MNRVLIGVCTAAAFVALLLIYGAIRSLMRLVAAAEIAVLPVKSQQTVALAAGDVELAVRGQQFRTGFGGVSFDLREVRSGSPVRATPVLIRSKSTSLSGEVTLAVMRFDVPGSGEYDLAAHGLHAGVDYADARFVLQHPYGFALTLRILWLVGSGILLVASVVFGVLLAKGIVAL